MTTFNRTERGPGYEVWNHDGKEVIFSQVLPASFDFADDPDAPNGVRQFSWPQASWFFTVDGRTVRDTPRGRLGDTRNYYRRVYVYKTSERRPLDR